MSPSLLSLEISLPKTAVVLGAVAVLACLDLVARIRHRQARYALGVTLGTILSFGLIHVAAAIMQSDAPKQGQAIALGVFLVIVAWRLLFGDWDAKTKATVLGTFVFWIFFHVLVVKSPEDRTAHLIAIGTAAIPAVIWCTLFLPYHRERLSVVFCMVFAGMLSTIPILFYDALVRGGAELNFFLFRIVPQSFSSSAHVFVTSYTTGISPLQTSIISMFVSFLFVGIIEETSKLWVLWRAGRRYVTSIDDVMQMAVLVAIGFAFAENVTNSGYFLNFVREFLLTPGKQDWGAFLGNVAGRSILTSMVHIVSTGIMGYYVGLALFAGPMLQEKQSRGIRYRMLEWCHDILGIPKRDLYRRFKIITGFSIAVFLHALSNFLVSLPEALPGNPRTVGDLLHSGSGSPLNFVALLLLPTLIYVVGGFTLLTALFQKKENMKERGHLIEQEVIAAEA
ncbi:MAG: PrsW family intramembrane metalloprotease [Candidatus Peribacteraceae bacterium]|nr:PrsW family intramembrane metalloprotease [Candidatus Peribacteraceae bacterium]